jgi:hypothetical protein
MPWKEVTDAVHTKGNYSCGYSAGRVDSIQLQKDGFENEASPNAVSMAEVPPTPKEMSREEI